MTVPGCTVQLHPRVSEGLAREVADREAGGILLGRRLGEVTLIEDFEPVLCEHRFGPAYVLSDDDVAGMVESLEWFRGLSAPPEILGFYRSQAPARVNWNERDKDLMRRFFSDAGSLLLLLSRGQHAGASAEFFAWDGITLYPAADPVVFPVDAVHLAPRDTKLQHTRQQETREQETRPQETKPRETKPSAEVPEPAPPARFDIGRETRPSEARLSLLNPDGPLSGDSEESPDRSWYWVAALVLLTLAGALVGYRSVDRPTPVPRAPGKERPSAERQAEASTVPAPAPATPAPVTAASIDQGVHAAIDRWQRAILSGDPDRIEACYAPRLERYFSQRNSTSTEVRRTALQSVARYGRPAILRVSGLNVLPIAGDRALATFRRHWQTGGPKVYAGEDQERMTFMRIGDEWKIVSEEEIKVYWIQEPR